MLHDFNLCGRSIISHNSKGVLGPHFARVVTAVGPHILTQGPNVWSTLTEIQRNIPKVIALISLFLEKDSQFFTITYTIMAYLND